ncbi:hypothetical protein [Celeribacter sp.]|uniref:hypothetical protein n=1 Tax=Celeribacter sp. TaxID=1890673 RepID=UPI003A91960C
MWKTALKSVTSTIVLGIAMAGPTYAETVARGAEAVLTVDGDEYRFTGNCLLMGRNASQQLRMTVPGSGPDGGHVHLVIYVTTYKPAQFTVYAAATEDEARSASLSDDRTTWLLRGGGSHEDVTFSSDAVSAELVTAVYSGGEKVVDETPVQVEIDGC